MGIIEYPDARASYRGPCGDLMDITLRIREGRIMDAKFVTDGCGATVACGSKLTVMINNMDVQDAMKISNIDLENALGGLPEENKHCAVLAVNTLRKAIGHYGH
jgi:nitrogen fixation NifU-like protein